MNPLASISAPILGTSWPGSRSTRNAPRSPSRKTWALVGERDEAADVHAVRRQRRRQVLERAGARREGLERVGMRRPWSRRSRRDRARAGAGPASAVRSGSAGRGRRSRAPARSRAPSAAAAASGRPPSRGRACRRRRRARRRDGRARRSSTCWMTPATSRRSASSRCWSVRAGDERLGVGQAVGPAPGDALGDDQRQRIAGVGDAVDLQAIADADVGGAVDPDEHPAGRVLDVERAPDGIDERHGGGHRHGVVQRGPVGPDVPDRPDRLEPAQRVRRRRRRSLGEHVASGPCASRQRPRISERVVSR